MDAVFHSFRGEKSALIIVKDKFDISGGIPVYVPKSAVEGLEPGDTLTIPSEYKITDWQKVELSDGTEVMLKKLSL